jgi:2-polyprenyl-3-methyl-5-hydroxy-6-metoxy-1,4-benzoquinol methylase
MLKKKPKSCYNKDYALDHQQNSADYWEYKELFRLYKPRVDDSILEIGCNTGDLLKILKEMGRFRITGIDINKEAIKIANRKVPEAKAECISVEKFLPPQKFNVIYGLHIIEHFSDPNKLISKAKDMLHTKGVFIISCPNRFAFLMRFEHYVRNIKFCYDPTHEHFYSLFEVLNVLKDNGFIIKHWSTQPLGLVSLWLYEKVGIRIPSLIFGGHCFVVAQYGK